MASVVGPGGTVSRVAHYDDDLGCAHGPVPRDAVLSPAGYRDISFQRRKFMAYHSQYMAASRTIAGPARRLSLSLETAVTVRPLQPRYSVILVRNSQVLAMPPTRATSTGPTWT